MMKRISVYVLLLCLLLLQSCLKEHSSGCESWLLLRFRYTLNGQYTNLFGAEVHKMTVYVFDAEEKYVGSFSEQGSQLTNDYVMRMPLPEGAYSIVACGGDFTTFQAGEWDGRNYNELRKGVTDLSDFCTGLKNVSGDGSYFYPAVEMDDLYAGFIKGAIATIGNQEVTEMDLIKNTKNVIVRVTTAAPVTALSSYTVDMPFDIYITSWNGRYLADNNIGRNDGTLKYTPVNTTLEENLMVAELRVMRLMLGQEVWLVVKNSLTSEVIYNENMIDQILLHPKYKTQQDIDREDRFVFEIGLQSQDNQVQVTVSINGWKINSIIPDV